MAKTADHEAKLRILVGRSSFDKRAFTIWIRDGQHEPPKRYRRYTAHEAKEILLPLHEAQIIIADSDISRRPQPIEGNVFVLSQTQSGWMVNDTSIGEKRGYMPSPLASRDLHFDIVTPVTAVAARRPRRRAQVLQFLQ